METVVRLNGAAEYVLDRLVTLGYFQTRTEALRAGVLGLGKEYGVVTTPQEMEDALAARKMAKVSMEIKTGKRKLVPLKDVLAEYGLTEKELA